MLIDFKRAYSYTISCRGGLHIHESLAKSDEGIYQLAWRFLRSDGVDPFVDLGSSGASVGCDFGNGCRLIGSRVAGSDRNCAEPGDRIDSSRSERRHGALQRALTSNWPV